MKVAKQILLAGWPLALLLVLNVIYFRIDLVMLSIFRSPAEVGYYALAYRIIENLLFFPAMFGGLLLPQLSQLLHVKSKQGFERLLQQSILLGFTASGCLVVILSLLAQPIIRLISGSSFLPAAPLLQILGVALAVMTIGNILGFSLVAANQQSRLLKLYLFLVVFNVGVNLIFIPQFGAAAAAWITLATEFIATAYAFWLINQSVSLIIPWFNVSQVALISVLTGVIIIPLNRSWPFVITLPIALLCYATLAHLIGLFSARNIGTLFHRHSS